MSACPSCGVENPAEARFCMACGAAQPGTTAGTATERRIVSILFVDLVGFTERSDQADPEDVRGTLVPFHSAVKSVIERFGGTLDKFIGDAALAVFGAPLAHEDDPERAIRAGLAILQAVPEIARQVPGLALRVAVNTGEVVVALGAGPQIGEALTGDVVNTTSRMQAAAPSNGLVVGEATYLSTRKLFHFQEQEPLRAKGKAEPLRTWLVAGERAREGAKERAGERNGPERGPRARLVGRGNELSLLRELLARSARKRVTQLVTIIGDPGIGKSRLVEEFGLRTGDQAKWYTGRCAPYGDGITFRPLAEVVRAESGIEQSDDTSTALAKLRDLVDRIEPAAAERDWLASRLEPLVGVASAGREDTAIQTREVAAAWSRLVEAPARDGPVVVVFEDLHWAEPVLREVIENIAAELAALPVLIVCTARPELFERDVHWGGGPTNSITIRLEQLSEADMSALLDELAKPLSLSADLRSSLLERAGGNPLYTLEFVRMLSEGPASRTDAEAAGQVPDSVQAMVAARLDSIPAELRFLAQDASVVGTEFWPGALASLSGLPEPQIREGIAGLVRRGLVRAEPSSWFPGQPEFGFVHALTREVAYSRIPRLDRARKHRAAGEWMERQAGDRGGEHAERMAAQFVRAFELAEAAGSPPDIEAARGRALHWVLETADRGARVDPVGAFSSYGRALGLIDQPTPDRARALIGSALSGRRSGELAAAEVLLRLEEALGIEEALGQPQRIADVLVRIGSQLGAMGESAASRSQIQRAIDLLEAQPPGRELARAYAYLAEDHMFGGRVDMSRSLADRALELARRFAADDVAVMSLHIRGDARCSLGDHAGIEDLEEALDISDARGNASDSVTSENYLAEWKWALEGPTQGLAHDERAEALAERRGVLSLGSYTKAHAVRLLTDIGEWDRALAICDELLSIRDDRLDPSILAISNLARARVLLLRGRAEEAVEPGTMLELVRPTGELQALIPALVVAAEYARSALDPVSARDYLVEFEQATRETASEYRESVLAEVARECVAIGELDLLSRMVDRSVGNNRRDRLNLQTATAVLAEARGQQADAAVAYATCADEWADFGCPLERAYALSGAARCLAVSGRDSHVVAEQARVLFDELGVAQHLRE